MGYDKFLFNTVFLTALKGVVANHLAQQANQEKLDAEDDQEYAYEERRLFMDWLAENEAAGNYKDVDTVPDEKGPEA